MKSIQSLINIDLMIKSKKWLAVKDVEKFINKSCKELIAFTEIKYFLQKKTSSSEVKLEIAISLVSDAQIKKINQQFRGKNKPTNVLSFSFLDEKLLRKHGFKKVVSSMQKLFLGDIVLSFETIEREAKKSTKDFYHHLTHLLLHSLLHLIGHDHKNRKDAKIMEQIEIEVLHKMNIKNPYI